MELVFFQVRAETDLVEQSRAEFSQGFTDNWKRRAWLLNGDDFKSGKAELQVAGRHPP
jgi:hypothetical protein